MSSFAMQRRWGPMPRPNKIMDYKPKDDSFIIISGPCSFESEKQINEIAKYVADSGATHLRSGIFRAGTWPPAKFGYIEKKAIESYANAALKNNLKNIIEVLNYEDWSFDFISDHCSAYQVGCRAMQHYQLLHKLGTKGKSVFLKRHPGTDIDEFLGAAEHLLVAGVKELFLIERGSVTHSKHVRWDLSLSMIGAVQAITKIPILADPSHGSGRRDLVPSLALAAVAAGANGVLIETHYDPDNSLSDHEQALGKNEYIELMAKMDRVRIALK